MIFVKKSKYPDSGVTGAAEASKQDLVSDAVQHREDVRNAVSWLVKELNKRITVHDYTKIRDPESDMYFQAFNEAAVKKVSFKSAPWYALHVLMERHHLLAREPKDVDLLDVLEFIADIVTANKARGREDLSRIASAMPEDLLYRAFRNTVDKLNAIMVVDEDAKEKKQDEVQG